MWRRVCTQKLCIISDADALGTDGKALGTVGVTHDRKVSVVLHGLGLEVLEHVGDADRQSNLPGHTALSLFTIAPP